MQSVVRKINPVVAAAVFSGVLFLALMGMRLGVFSTQPEFSPVRVASLTGKDTWMNILQKDRKIGYSHRQIMPQDAGFRLLDTTYMRINTMGMVQDLHMRTSAELNADLTLSGFDFTLRSNLFDFHGSGRVQDGILTVDVGGQKATFPVDEGLFLTGGILDAAWDAGLKEGQTRTFSVFDPTTMGRRPVQVTAEGEEELEIMGQRQVARKYAVDFMGSRQTAWLGKDGNVLQEKGIMGITLQRVTQQEAFNDLALSPSQDLTQSVSIKANIPLNDPEKLDDLKIEISGIENSLFLDGGRQTYAERILTIKKETLPNPGSVQAEDLDKYLKPTPFIESDHEDIQRLVASLVKPTDKPLEKINKLSDWIYHNIEKRPVISVPDALQTLKTRAGDCNEHAVLMAAMARAAGIPAQIEAGLVYLDGRFYYHAWNALYLDGWITVDSLMNQIPADVTHIRFVRGEPAEQVDLMQVIGKINLKIMDLSS